MDNITLNLDHRTAQALTTLLGQVVDNTEGEVLSRLFEHLHLTHGLPFEGGVEVGVMNYFNEDDPDNPFVEILTVVTDL